MGFAFEPTPSARGFSLHIDTFADVRQLGDVLVEWVEASRQLVETPFGKLTEDRAFGFDIADGYWVGGGGTALDGESTVFDWDQDSWATLLRRLGQGELRNLRLVGQLQDAFGFPDDEVGGFLVEIDLAGLEFEGAATGMTVTIGRPLLGNQIPSSVQADWVRHAELGVITFSAVTGFLTVDYAGPYETPYEMSIGRYWLDGRRECDEWLRGYYWANFLSSEHLKRLGGQEVVVQSAPCAQAREVSPNQVFLQLTESVDDVSDEALRSLKRFLAPVLPKPKEGYSYTGPPLRVV